MGVTGVAYSHAGLPPDAEPHYCDAHLTRRRMVDEGDARMRRAMGDREFASAREDLPEPWFTAPPPEPVRSLTGSSFAAALSSLDHRGR